MSINLSAASLAANREERRERRGETHSSDAIRLRVISVNDVYTLDNLARLKTCIDTKAFIDPVHHTIITFNGDMLGGCLLFDLDKGASMVDICNKIGVDYFCFGNHEFDHGRDELMKRISEFKGCWLNSNIRSADKTDNLSLLCPDFTIQVVPVNGKALRIGLFGICTEATPDLTTGTPLKEGFTFTSCVEATRRVLSNHLRRGIDCDFVIALTHQGFHKDKFLFSKYCEKPASEAKIDLILGGHDHVPVYRGYPECKQWGNKDFGERMLVKAGMDAVNCDIVDIEFENDSVSMVHELVPLKGYEPDPEIAEAVASHKQILDKQDFSLICLHSKQPQKILDEWNACAAEMLSDGFPEMTPQPLFSTKLSRCRQVNFTTLMASFIKAELAQGQEDETLFIINSGNFRWANDYVQEGHTQEPRQCISYNDLKKELTFDNPISKVFLSGNDIQELINYSETERKGQGSYMQYDITSMNVVKSGAGHAVLVKEILGQPFSPTKIYSVITVSKLLIGMDRFPLFMRLGKECDASGRETAQSIVESSPGMATVMINRILKDKWLFPSVRNHVMDTQASLSPERLAQEIYESGIMAKSDCNDFLLQMMFEILDTNNDGMIDRDDMAVLESRISRSGVCEVNMKDVISPRKKVLTPRSPLKRKDTNQGI